MKNLTLGNLIQTIVAHTDKPQGLYKNGFYFLAGFGGGILLNDIWRFFNLPFNDQPITNAKGEKTDMDMDFVIQAGIGGLLIALDWFFGLKNGAPTGAGIIAGAKMANTSEKGKYVGAATLGL